MMPIGARTNGHATCGIAVPTALPVAMRAKVRELLRLKSPGDGYGGLLMTAVLGEADATGTPLFLHVDPDDGDIDRMAGWYGRYGFVAVQDAPRLMLRNAR